MTAQITIRPEAQRVIDALEAAGGRALLVGGSVVDLLQGREPKDWDLEVYGLAPSRVPEVLAEFKPKSVGKAFGIHKLSSALVGGLDIDVSVPRRDNNTGIGHKDFECELDPRMSPEEAARRRDFTVNALYWDPATGSIIDHFGGLDDLDSGVLRATDAETFVEDPLRVLRAMQLSARKCPTVDPGTLLLCKGMVEACRSLPKERLYEEWRKLFLKADRPSVGLRFLESVGGLTLFPELEALVECGQNPEHHPEGTVWEHTCRVSDTMAYARDKVPEEWREAFAFAVPLHDIGKPAVTVTPKMVAEGKEPADMLWTARQHDIVGGPIAESFLRRLTDDKDLIRKVTTLVEQHMQPYHLGRNPKTKASAYKRLHRKIRLDVIGWMCRCDSCGTGGRKAINDPDLEHLNSSKCWAHFDEIGPEPIPKVVQGRDLIAAGVKPGPSMGKMIEAAYQAQLDRPEATKEELLEVAKAAQ